MNAAMRDDPSVERAFSAMTALGRIGEVEDIADAAAFLASPDSGWVTGQYLEASGGLGLVMPGFGLGLTRSGFHHHTNGDRAMRYRLLGKSGLRVSELCLGTMTFGEDWGWGSSKDESRRVLDAFLEAGGNFIDTANVYTNGTSETLLGEFLEGRPRPGRPGDQVHQRHARHRPQRRRQPAQEHDAVGRGQPEAAQDRLHRPLLAPHLGPDHARSRR